MKYLILGSSGLIGQGLVSWLQKNGHDVLEFDLKNNDTQDLRIPNNPVLNSLLLDVDFVYFLAFDIGGSKFLANNQDNFDFIQNNLKILTNTFDLLNQTGIPFIFSSTQMSAMTHSNYGLTKLLGEKLTSSLGGVTVKFWNVYGAEPISEKSHVVADFIYSAQNNNSIVMLTDGKESRQMLHVDDCSNALYILSQHYDTLPRDKEYHITSFSWVTVQEIANTVAGFFPGCKVIPGHDTDVVQQDLQKQPDLHILTYWQPQITLETGVRSLI